MNEPHPPQCELSLVSDLEPLNDERIAEIAKALAHPARIRILEQFVSCQPHIAREINAELDLAQSTVSEHLRFLRESGLLTATPAGPRTWYCMQRALMEQFATAVLELADSAVLTDVG